MKKIILMLMLACGLALNVSAGGDRLVKVAPGYSENSVNTAVFRNNSLVTDGDYQYVCYYDADGNPYIATYWRSADSKVPQYRLVWFNGKRWNSRQVSNRTTPFSLSGIGTKMIPVARPRIVVDGEKTVAFEPQPVYVLEVSTKSLK